MCKLILFLGCSGSGKSTKAKELAKKLNAIVCSADHYFYDVFGKYNFDASKLGHAHKMCYDKAYRTLEQQQDVIIDNTNANAKDRKVYEDLAKSFGIEVEYVEPETSWKYDIDELIKKNTKGTPREVIEKQLNGVMAWKNSKK